jgi:hypothetical protein
MFESKELRNIFGSKKDEVSEQFSIYHNGELCDVSIVRTVISSG